MENDSTEEIFHDQQLSNVLKKLNEQRKIGENCDYTLKTEDGVSFAVHKFVLESVSPFFVKMFNFGFNEKEKHSVVLKRCSSAVLEKIIEFMYTGQMKITSDIAKSTLDTGLFLGLDNLVDVSTRVLIKTANCENCFDLLAYSETYFSGELLTEKCLEIICENLKMLMDSSGFDGMPLDSMKLLCSCDRSLCTDEQLYLAIVKWIKFDMANRELHLQLLLDHIKFEEITVEFVMNEISKDHTLWKNYDYFSKIIAVLSKNWAEQIGGNKNRKLFYSFEPENLYAVVDNKMLLYDCGTKLFSTVITQLDNNRLAFGHSTFGEKNLFVCGGVINGKKCNDCAYFSLEDNSWKFLPSMKISRYCHGAITVDNKIYVCGGCDEKIVDIFDINESKWMRGRSFNRAMPNPGLCLYNEIIFCVQGSSIQFLDIRTNKWIALPSLSQNKGFMCSAINYKDYIYAFALKEVCTFDIRATKWLEDVTMYEKSHNSNVPRTCMINNEIYVLGRISDDDDENFMFNSYKASNFSENICHIMKLERKYCSALFSL